MREWKAGLYNSQHFDMGNEGIFEYAREALSYLIFPRAEYDSKPQCSSVTLGVIYFRVNQEKKNAAAG